jgi:hypothetical protein
MRSISTSMGPTARLRLFLSYPRCAIVSVTPTRELIHSNRDHVGSDTAMHQFWHSEGLGRRW